MISMIAAACLASAPALKTAAPDATTNPHDRARTIVVCPGGLVFPAEHRGLAQAAPGVAVQVFEPDAEVDFGPIAALSHLVTLHELHFDRDGSVRSLTFDLPGSVRFEGDALARYLTIAPGGAAEFAVASNPKPGEALILRTDADTGALKVLASPDEPGTASVRMELQDDGSVRFTFAPAD